VEQIRFDGTRIGDMTNESRSFLVERKAEDFWNLSHTQTQLDNMYSLTGVRLFLWIQGTYGQWLESHEKACEVARRGGFSSPSLQWGLSLLTTGQLYQDLSVSFLSIPEMVSIALAMDQCAQEKGEMPLIRKTPKMESTFLTLLCSIKGIGKKKGEALLARFGSPIQVFLAEDQELLEVSGVGPGIVKSIREYTETV
jgi:ERCC4-type nuclease